MNAPPPDAAAATQNVGAAAAPKAKKSASQILLRNVMSNWMGLALNMATAFFMSPFLVRTLGDTWYGMWVLIRSTTGYMGMLDGGVRMAVVKFVARADALGDSRELNRTVSTAFVLYCIAASVAALGTIGLAIAFPYMFNLAPETVPTARLVVLIAGVSLCVSLLSSVQGGILTGMQRFDLSNQIGITTLLARTLLIVVLLLMGYGIVAIAITQVAMQFLAWALIAWNTRRIRPDLSIRIGDASRESAKGLYGYGSATLVSNIGDLLLFRTGELIAAMFLGPAAVTYYAIAGTLVEYLQKIVVTMAQTLHPFSSANQARGQVQALQKIFLIGAKLCFLIALPVTAGLILFGHEFIGDWMGESYAAQAGPLLIALAAGRLFWISQSGTFQILLGAGHHMQVTAFNVITGVLSFAGGVAMVQNYGLLGMTIGAAVPIAVMHGFVTPIYAARTLKIPLTTYAFEAILRPLAATAPFVLTLLLLERWIQPNSILTILEVGVIAAPVLVVSAYFLAFNEEERAKYVNRFFPKQRRST